MTQAPHLLELQQWLARAEDITGGGLTEIDTIDQIRALEEAKAAIAAAQARLTPHLYAERARREAAKGVPAAERCAGLGSEVALARRVSPYQGNKHLGVALVTDQHQQVA